MLAKLLSDAYHLSQVKGNSALAVATLRKHIVESDDLKAAAKNEIARLNAVISARGNCCHVTSSIKALLDEAMK